MQSVLEHRSPGRPRCEETRNAILRAAYEILEEGGLDAFTIEAVAERSGAAKTTIYRWWPNRGALAIESFLELSEKYAQFPQTESAIADLRTQMRRFARALRGRIGQIVSSILAEAQTCPETRQAFVEGYINPRRAALQQLIDRGVAQGEFRPNLPLNDIGDALYGSLLMRVLLRHAPLSDAAVDQLVDTTLQGLGAR
ncbi:MAG TPA: TetR/AcrR family transcriptional regulator [Stellaceae bacterium]|nr:TetR/AcrR family transcriptional regulator [Stellaceae bacterium]